MKFLKIYLQVLVITAITVGGVLSVWQLVVGHPVISSVGLGLLMTLILTYLIYLDSGN